MSRIIEKGGLKSLSIIDFTGSGGSAWGVSFGDLLVVSSAKGKGRYVWCVRGGQGVDSQ